MYSYSQLSCVFWVHKLRFERWWFANRLSGESYGYFYGGENLKYWIWWQQNLDVMQIDWHDMYHMKHSIRSKNLFFQKKINQLAFQMIGFEKGEHVRKWPIFTGLFNWNMRISDALCQKRYILAIYFVLTCNVPNWQCKRSTWNNSVLARYKTW